jgi:hypothetical protein
MPKRTLILDSSAFDLTDESCSNDSSDDFIILPHPKDQNEPIATALPGWTPTTTPTTIQLTTPSPSFAPKKPQAAKVNPTTQVRCEGESSASPSSKRVKRADKADKKGTKTVSEPLFTTSTM